MNTTISKTRSKKSRQRDKQDKRTRKRPFLQLFGSLALFALFWLGGLLQVHLGGHLRYSQLLTGQQAPATIIASADFSCIDLNETIAQQQRAVASVPPVFRLANTSVKAGTRALERLFNHLGTTRQEEEEEPAPTPGETIEEMLTLLDIRLSNGELAYLASGRNTLPIRDFLLDCLAHLENTPVITEEDRTTGFQGLAVGGRIALIKPASQTAQRVRVEHIQTPSEALARSISLLAEEQRITARQQRIVASMLRPWVVPNLSYDPITTTEHQEQARLSVPPIIAPVHAGTTLVEAGERITPAIQERLRSYDQRLRELTTRRDRALHMLGDALLLLITLFIAMGLLRTVRPELLGKTSALLLLAALYLLCISLLKGLLYLSNTTDWISQALLLYLYPAGLLALLTTILLGGQAALAVGLLSACTASIMLGYSFHALLYGLFITVVAIRASHGIHRRSRLFRAGLFAGISAVLYAIASHVLYQPAWQVLLRQALTGLGSGLLAAFLTLLLIPVFEALFHITTDITLLELSDMGNPLLQRLAIEAPGTYHHSLMVANLGASAAQEIGANALAVRVGAYFHDIGKLTKPEFFIENAQQRANPHDDLSPSMSTLVVTSHVKEGLTLAERHKLPPIILEAIAQHHGTTVVSYFFHRAREQMENQTAQDGSARKTAPRIEEQDYRYPGPRPQTPEMAILALADSIEAASRSIEKTTSSRIENLVNEIVDKKVLDGQLDDSDLTLRQLARIKRSFIFTLNSMLHGRVAYPENEKNHSQPTNQPAA